MAATVVAAVELMSAFGFDWATRLPELPTLAATLEELQGAVSAGVKISCQKNPVAVRLAIE